MSTAVVLHIYHIVILIRKFVFHTVETDWVSVWFITFAFTVIVRLMMDFYIFAMSAKYFKFIAKRKMAAVA